MYVFVVKQFDTATGSTNNDIGSILDRLNLDSSSHQER